MSIQTLERPSSPTLDLFPTLKLWTVEECKTLCQMGLIAERYELIEGILLEEMLTSPLHTLISGLLLDALASLFGLKRIRVEGTIRLSEAMGQKNLLVPDIAVTKEERRTYKENPLPKDLLLVVEVVDSSLKSDLTLKARLYAEAGIPEYWVVDVQGRKLVVHREPTPEGYQSVTECKEGESVSPLAMPEKFVVISELLD